MPPATTLLFVQINRINIRRQHLIGDNLNGFALRGDPLEVLAEVSVETEDGWVWRRLASSEWHWVAERNTLTGQVLLDTSPPEAVANTPTELQRLFVVVNGVKVRSEPRLLAGNEIGFCSMGEALSLEPNAGEVGPDGWVWRRLKQPQEGWTAEYNCRTGHRLLSPFEPQPVVDPALTPPAPPLVVSDVGRVKARSTSFEIDGNACRFVGVNLREFPFYGRKDVLPHTKISDQDLQVKAAAAMKLRTIRMHACHRSVPVDEAVPLVKAALDVLHGAGLLAIVVLNDALGEYYVPGDQRFHIHVMGHLDKQAYFVEKGYRENYIPYVKRMVGALKDHPAVFAWELGNEYAIIPQPASLQESDAFLSFAAEASNLIRSLDPNHLITTGLVNTGHVAPSGHDRAAYAERLYRLPSIDFGTVHFYEDNSEEHSSRPDLDVLRKLGKPLIVEEYSATSGDRVNTTASRIEAWTAGGAAGFMQWALSATPMDIGVGDNERGMDPYAHGNRDHYHRLVDLYRRWAERLSQ